MVRVCTKQEHTCLSILPEARSPVNCLVAESSRAYMINKSGDTIADITLDTITTQNIEQEAQSNTSLKQLASIHADMRQGKNGFGSFQDSDGERFAAYAPVGNTDGWSVAVTALKSEYLADTYFGFIINIIVIAASILASIVVALKLSSNISAPMHACARRMKLLVEGDLDSPVPQATGRDETAELTRSTAEMVNGLNIIINDISYLLTEMAKQNFDIQSAHREDYVGDFQNILLSMRTLKVELSNTIRQLDSGTGSHDQRHLRKCEKDVRSCRRSRLFCRSGRCTARHQRGICQGTEYRHGKDLSLFSGDLPDHCYY